jgi:replicative DNA helicase
MAVGLLGTTTNEQILINILKSEPDNILRFDRNYFVSQIARDLFEAIKNCYLADMPLSSDNIVIHGNKLNGQINKQLVDDLSKVDFNVDTFDQHYRLLRKEYAKYEIENVILKDVLRETSKKGELNTEKFENLKDQIVEALDIIQGKESLLKNLESSFERYEGILLQRKKGNLLYETGDHQLDRYLTLGFSPGHMTTFMADSGVGKSVVTLNLANKQINKRIPCLYITLENNEELTMDRLAAMRCGINYEDLYFKNGKEDDEIFSLLEKERKLIKDCNTFFMVDEPELSLDDIELLIKEAKRRMNTDYLCVFLDLQSMVKDFANNIDPQSIEQNVNKQHRIAKRQNCHFVNVLQTNGMATNFKPVCVKDCLGFRFKSISDIKNARAFGERSRAVIGLVRPKLIAENIFGKENPEVEIMDDLILYQCIKQNQGSTFNIKKVFFPERFQIFNYVER